VRYLQRLGLDEVARGKGRGISYTRIQAGEWMLALLLAEFGIDPVVVVNSIQRERGQLREWSRRPPKKQRSAATRFS
jgi:hypothetical protein